MYSSVLLSHSLNSMRVRGVWVKPLGWNRELNLQQYQYVSFEDGMEGAFVGCSCVWLGD